MHYNSPKMVGRYASTAERDKEEAAESTQLTMSKKLVMAEESSGPSLEHLPGEVLDMILEKTSFQDVYKWRFVCKRWRHLIGFKTGPLDLSSTQRFPLLVKVDTCSQVTKILTFHGGRQCWMVTDIRSCLPRYLDYSTNCSLHYFCRGKVRSRQYCSLSFRYLAAGNLGLLFLSYFNSKHIVIICNPVTTKWRNLDIPDIPSSFAPSNYFGLKLVAVIENPANRHYKLLFATRRNLQLSFGLYAVYNSHALSWKFSKGPEGEFPDLISYVNCHNYLYILHKKDSGRKNMGILNWKNPTMRMYNHVTDEWTEIKIVPKHQGQHLPQLIQVDGNVLYVASGHNWRGFFKLVDLDTLHRLRWELTRYVPNAICEELDRRTSTPLKSIQQEVCCEGQGNYIYFYAIQPRPLKQWKRSERGYSKYKDSSKFILIHHFVFNTWVWLPDYSFVPGESQNVGAEDMFSFRPSFLDV